jgi:hypothetical protein
VCIGLSTSDVYIVVYTSTTHDEEMLLLYNTDLNRFHVVRLIPARVSTDQPQVGSGPGMVGIVRGP